MKNLKFLIHRIILVLLIMASGACNKDDDPIPPKPQVIDKPDPDPVNQAPNSFSLLTPEIDSAIVNRSPTFSWEQATDPDGDTVIYDLYIDTQENPSTLVAENLSTTSFELTENLDFETQYYWKVVAKDDNGASTEMIQSLRIEVPVKLWSQYNQNGRNGAFDITYVQGKVTTFDDFLTTYDNSSTKLERLLNSKNNVAHEYKYTNFGKQLEIYVQYGEDNHRWTFEYDDNDRIYSITQAYERNGITLEIGESVFAYEDVIDPYPTQIVTTFDEGIIVRHTLQWEGGNIVERLNEVDLQSGNGYEFRTLTKIEYDNNINPYYLILSNHFGFSPFHVLVDAPTGLESLDDFFIFKWQSFNNITAYEVFDDPNAPEPVDGYRMNYSYSEDYYPLSASEFLIDQNSTYLVSWSYLDE